MMWGVYCLMGIEGPHDQSAETIEGRDKPVEQRKRERLRLRRSEILELKRQVDRRQREDECGVGYELYTGVISLKDLE